MTKRKVSAKSNGHPVLAKVMDGHAAAAATLTLGQHALRLDVFDYVDGSAAPPDCEWLRARVSITGGNVAISQMIELMTRELRVWHADFRESTTAIMSTTIESLERDLTIKIDRAADHTEIEVALNFDSTGNGRLVLRAEVSQHSLERFSDQLEELCWAFPTPAPSGPDNATGPK